MIEATKNASFGIHIALQFTHGAFKTMLLLAFSLDKFFYLCITNVRGVSCMYVHRGRRFESNLTV